MPSPGKDALRFAVDLARAYAGALIFGLPLLMTMVVARLLHAFVEARAAAGGDLPRAGGTLAARRFRAVLKVRGMLRQGDAVLGEADTEFDFLPGHSTREAGLFFRHDPRAHALDLVAVSYQQP